MCGCPVLVLSRAITDAVSVATFPRYLMVEYGVPAGEAFTVVAHSQAVGGGARCDCMSHISVNSSWALLSLAHWLQILASFAGSTDTCP